MEEVCPKHTLQKILDHLFKKDKEWHKQNVKNYLIKNKSKEISEIAH